jgi:hypothetical protein
MKYLYIFLFLLSGGFILSNCSKSIDEFQRDLEPLNPTQTDADAGTWQTIVLTSNSEMPLSAPVSRTAPSYTTELQTMKTNMANLTPAQRNAIKYWSAGSVLRWNQIMRELVAKYNLPPVTNANGQYPFPDANNPFDYPQFPFSNPPYASRAYAYVAVVQYDALVAAYHYKELYQGQAPYQVDNTIEPLVPKSVLPSYPCEDAVVAAATLELLKFLFPAEVGYLEQKAIEAKNYKLWAGAAVQSDITASDALGKAIAAKVLTRAKTDNMKNAIGTQADWDNLAKKITDLGETPWKSLETPARPPMLPFFGGVKTWLFDAATLVSIRPPAPFKVGTPEFQQQLEEVKREASSKDREKLRITHYWADGAGTYTPPGHWNSIAFDLIYAEKQSEVRTARTFALLNMAMMDAAIACWETKTYYYFPRPSQIDPSIKTLTGVPNFPAYTSGHSTFSWSAATVLGHLFPEAKSKLENMATEASLSRLYGGIHYRMDCEVGAACGKVIGNFAITRANTDGAD